MSEPPTIPRPSPQGFWRRLRSRPRLWLELSLIVILKVLLLYIAKQLWFSQPLAPHMRVAPERIEQQFFGQAATPVSPSPEQHNDLPR
ncbi:cytochrome oxidase putative small subunit CydP [Chitinimonas sp.]|uniref:cytochrome oxidase putative small subunit CydP n=1 Tax=Chitinimonas sp. TaxID=1934313 RepID=UPI002F936E11